MNLLSHQLWIGFGFVVLLVAFLIFAFFVKENLTPDQRNILRFLTSLCAAFAGALITGDALFRLEGAVGKGTNVVISGVAGIALFFVVWFFPHVGAVEPNGEIRKRSPRVKIPSSVIIAALAALVAAFAIWKVSQVDPPQHNNSQLASQPGASSADHNIEDMRERLSKLRAQHVPEASLADAIRPLFLQDEFSGGPPSNWPKAIYVLLATKDVLHDNSEYFKENATLRTVLGQAEVSLDSMARRYAVRLFGEGAFISPLMSYIRNEQGFINLLPPVKDGQPDEQLILLYRQEVETLRNQLAEVGIVHKR